MKHSFQGSIDMDINEIDRVFEEYIKNKTIPNGILLIRKNGELIYRNKWGYSDIEKKIPVQYDSIYRMMSMTKPVTAAAVMTLYDKGLLSIDDPVSKFVPSFKNARVVCDKRYPFPPKNPLVSLLGLATYSSEKVKTVKPDREMTIRDLLSHSSGLGQGIGGIAAMLKDKTERTTNAEQVENYARLPLDFQPGTGTGYSPLAGFDVLVSVIENASGMSASEFYKKAIFEPLNMTSSSFFPDTEQKNRLVHIYKHNKNSLKDVTGTKKDMQSFFRFAEGSTFVCGAGGMYGTVEDYDNFAHMLLNGGVFEGRRVLSENAVQLMQTEAPAIHLEPEPGFVWGLGVKIRQDPIKGKTSATKGTYGWSGAYGTHFFVSPTDNMECVFVTNVSNIGGASSKVSFKVEELVFGIFADKENK